MMQTTTKAEVVASMTAAHDRYQRYLEIMYDHGQGDVALTFTAWLQCGGQS